MPALSKKQQQFFGMVLQYKRGELNKDDVSPEIVKAANSMSMKDVEDYASTDHDGLPNKVDEGSWSDGFNKDLRNSKIDSRTKNKYIMLDKDGNILKNIYGDAISPAGIRKAAKWRSKEDGISINDIALINLDTMDIINNLTFTGFSSRGKLIFNKLNENNGLPDKKTDERLESFRKLIRKEVIENLKNGTYNRDVLKSLIESGRPLNEATPKRIKLNQDLYIDTDGYYALGVEKVRGKWYDFEGDPVRNPKLLLKKNTVLEYNPEYDSFIDVPTGSVEIDAASLEVIDYKRI